jgi:hypothetical protein
MPNTVTAIVVHEHPNAVCAICRKIGRLSPAAALRTFGHWHQFYVCDGHAERAARWDRGLAISDRYRKARAHG